MRVVTKVLRFLGLSGGLAILVACESQRTVTHTESKIGFGDGWQSQLGDEKKMKEKYASGFEIKDGRAVATGDRPNPFEKKEFSTGEFGTNSAGDSKKEYSKKEFGSEQKAFETKSFSKGSPAREAGSRSIWERKNAPSSDDEFGTQEWAEAAREFGGPQAAREHGSKFRFTGRHGRESSVSATAQRVELDTSNPQAATPGSAVGTLSVDDVRKMLNPEVFR
jgi:hypothetical protein